MSLAKDQPQARRQPLHLLDQGPAVGNLEIIGEAQGHCPAFELFGLRIEQGQALPAFVQRFADQRLELVGPQGWRQATPGAHEQWVAIDLAQTPQGSADCRLGQAQAYGSAAGADFVVQGFEDFEQVEVDVGDICRIHIIQKRSGLYS
ncbi:hypothetical protein D3C85_1265480 [compost metagenome]